MVNTTMKNILILFALLFAVSNCAKPVDSVSWGKKCIVTEDKVVYSYVWLYNKDSGLSADQVQCKEIADKK